MFLAILIPITYRAKLTFDGNANKATLKFTRRQTALLAGLLVVGIVGVGAYGIFTYNTTSLSAKYTGEERYEKNCAMTQILQDELDFYDEDTLVTTIETAYPTFGQDHITYSAAVYIVDDTALESYEQDLETIRGLSKSKAAAVAKDGIMARTATATIVVDNVTGEVLGITLDMELKP